MTSGIGLRHKLTSIHNRRHLCLSISIMCFLHLAHENGRRLYHYRAKNRRPRHSCANMMRPHHSFAIRRRLCSYFCDFRHQSLPMKVILVAFWLSKKFQSTCPADIFLTNLNDFTPNSNDCTPYSIKPFWIPCLDLINLFTCHAISLKWYLPWEEKAKMVVRGVKGC